MPAFSSVDIYFEYASALISDGLQQPVSPAPGDLMPASGLMGTFTHICVHTEVFTHTYKKMLTSLKKKINPAFSTFPFTSVNFPHISFSENMHIPTAAYLPQGRYRAVHWGI